MLHEACEPDIPLVQHRENLTGLCASCEAACCQQGAQHTLRREEFNTMRALYGDIYRDTTFFAGRMSPKDPEICSHTLRVDCPALDPETLGCRLRDDSARPEVCGVFEAGSPNCHTIRNAALTGIQRVKFERRRTERIPRENS